jgi:hypothetical protein
MKSGGAKVRVINNDIPGQVAANLRTTAGAMADDHRHDMAGYALVAWANDLTVSSQVFIGNGAVVPRVTVPDFVKSVVAEHLVASAVTEED